MTKENKRGIVAGSGWGRDRRVGWVIGIILLTLSMAEGIIKYNTAQYADPLVLLSKSGYVYLKCDRASMGYYILRCNTNICEKLKETTQRESHVCCEEFY